MTPEQIRFLFDFNAWANHRVLDACAVLTPEQFTRDLRSSLPSVRDTLVHTYGAEWVWLERWHGRSPSALPAGNDFSDLASLRKRWAELETAQKAYLAKVSATDLDRVIEYVNFKGQKFAYPLGAMLQHVVNHGTYHRGQVAAMLRQLGAKPLSTDLLRYYDALAGQLDD
jgi:uncharacterized damage-inducible protein DinB